MQPKSRRQTQLDGFSNTLAPNPYLRPKYYAMYRGPGLPTANTPQINPPERVDVNLIFDSITQIVMTRLGERLMLPQFGSRIFELIGEPLNQVFEYLVQQYLTNALIQWEPRARIANVSFLYGQDGQGTDHSVQVTYTMTVPALGINAQSTFKIPRG